MQNSEYWKQRFTQLEAAQNRMGAETFADIERQYQRAQREIEGQIARWHQRFADNNGITLAEARKMLDKGELKELKWDVQEYIKRGQENAVSGKWMKELENASARFHISRLEALKIQTQQSMETLFAKQDRALTAAMGKMYKSSYYRTAYEVQKGFNIGWDIAGVDQRTVEKIISKPWAADGKNFSERIWSNKERLIREVHNELTQNILLGADPQKAIDKIAKKMNTSKHNAGRLVMTEEAYFSSTAQRDCFNELDVEQYEIVATLDSHTSDICRSLDGKVFPMKDYEAGVTAPPFHVYCRSTTVPYFDDDFGQPGERAARDEATGKTYYVPADMSYQEWKEAFVDGGDKSRLAEVNEKSITKEADYLVRSHVPGVDVTAERAVVNKVISSMPSKVQRALNSGTIIDIGKEGASQYDYVHDILYIAKGADETEVIHEIGHMVENRLMDSEKVKILKKKFLQNAPVNDIVTEIYYDASGNPREIFLLKMDGLISEYQGRIYANDWSEIYDDNWNIKPELMQEFMSEPFREYIMNPKRTKNEFPEFYELIREVVE